MNSHVVYIRFCSKCTMHFYEPYSLVFEQQIPWCLNNRSLWVWGAIWSITHCKIKHCKDSIFLDQQLGRLELLANKKWWSFVEKKSRSNIEPISSEILGTTLQWIKHKTAVYMIPSVYTYILLKHTIRMKKLNHNISLP